MLLRADLGNTAVNWRNVRCRKRAPTELGGYTLQVDRARCEKFRSTKVQPTEQPHLEPVEAGKPDEAGAGYGEKERRPERRHQDAG